MSHVLTDAARVAAVETPEGTIFEMVPITKMFLDDAYGRNTNMRNLGRLRDGWDILKMGTLYVSLRPDGSYAVIDGWHRKIVAEEKGTAYLPCYVYLDLTLSQEAALYDAFGTVFAQSPLVKFRARLVSGDPVAVDLDRAITEAGLQINYTSHAAGARRYATNIQSVVAVEGIYHGYGRDHLIRVLRNARRWFPDDPRSLKGEVLRAISAFLAQYMDNPKASPRVDLARMEARCLDKGFVATLRRAESIRVNEQIDMAHAFGKALWATYNLGLSEDSARRLEEWRTKTVSPGGAKKAAQLKREAAARRKNGTAHKSHTKTGRHAIWTPGEIADRPD